MNYKKVMEGLREGDLEELVSSTISIDEFESKIDDDSIVVGFFVADKEPANDLSIFIETSGKDSILDTEVSPSTDENGNYVVFVEFVRDDNFPNELIDVLETLTNLANIKSWTFTYYGSHESEEKLTRNNIETFVRLSSNNNDKKNEAINFLKNTILDDLRIYTKRAIFEKNGIKKEYVFEDFGDPKTLFEKYKISEKPIQYDPETIKSCNQLRSILGENWDVNVIDGFTILANSTDQSVMILK